MAFALKIKIFSTIINRYSVLLGSLIFATSLMGMAQNNTNTLTTEFSVKNGQVELFGLKDSNGNIILPAKFGGIYWRQDGYAVVDDSEDLTKQGLIDSLGNVILDPLRYCGFNPNSGNNNSTFNEHGLLVVYNCLPNDVLVFGLVNKIGKEIVTPKYHNLSDFNEGFASVSMVNESGIELFGFIDPSGSLITPIVFEEVREFSDGLAAVKYPYSEFGYINTLGKHVVPSKYSEVGYFKNGEAMVKTGSTETVEQYQTTYQTYIINKEGEKKKFLMKMVERVKSNDINSVKALISEAGASGFEQYDNYQGINLSIGQEEQVTLIKSSDMDIAVFKNFSISVLSNGNLQYQYSMISDDVSFAQQELIDSGFKLMEKAEQYSAYSDNVMVVILPNESSAVSIPCFIFKIPTK